MNPIDQIIYDLHVLNKDEIKVIEEILIMVGNKETLIN
jgi:hypothetical protein